MARANYCEFFRFDNRYCDVFKEDGYYLYVEAEYGNYNGFLMCNEWHAVETLSGRLEWIRYDLSNADAEYLEALEPAPVEVARSIIRREYARTLYYTTRDEATAAYYGYDEPPTMAECIEQAETYAGILVD